MNRSLGLTGARLSALGPDGTTGETSSPVTHPSVQLSSRGTKKSLAEAQAETAEGGTRELVWSNDATTSGEQMREDQIDVWRIDFDRVAADVVEQLRDTLSADEGARANRFRFDRDRRVFVITRGALRSLLAGRLGVSPSEIRFRYGSAGKPSLADLASGGELHFNVTHAGSLALIAITRAGEIGIDVEPVRDLPDWEGVARLVFDAGQVAQLKSRSEPMRMQAFFRAWTRKEAVAKARGTGLGGTELKGPFSVNTFCFSPNWVASIAASRAGGFLRCRFWDSNNSTLPLTVRPYAPFSPAAGDSAVSL